MAVQNAERSRTPFYMSKVRGSCQRLAGRSGPQLASLECINGPGCRSTSFFYDFDYSESTREHWSIKQNNCICTEVHFQSSCTHDYFSRLQFWSYNQLQALQASPNILLCNFRSHATVPPEQFALSE